MSCRNLQALKELKEFSVVWERVIQRRVRIFLNICSGVYFVREFCEAFCLEIRLHIIWSMGLCIPLVAPIIPRPESCVRGSDLYG